MSQRPLTGLLLKHGDKLSGGGMVIVGTALTISEIAGNEKVAHICNGIALTVLGVSLMGIWKTNKRQTDMIVASEAEKRLQTGTGTGVSVIAKEMVKQVQNRGPDSY